MSDVEIIDVEETISSSPKNSDFLELLTANDSGEDDDIICVNTVFRPANVNSTPQKENNNQSSLSKTSTNSDSMNTENECVANSSINEHSSSKNINASLGNYLSPDEETIDELVEPPPPPSKHLYKLYNDLTESVNEPPQKKLKQKGGNNSTNSSSKSDNNSELISAQSKIDIKDCKYYKPPTSFIALIILILKNSNCLLSHEIWNYLSGLFPYYEYLFDPVQGDKKVKRATMKGDYFLKNPNDIIKKGKEKLIMLNPVNKKEQELLLEKIAAQKEKLKGSLYVPEVADSLLAGELQLSTVKLFLLRPHKSRHSPSYNDLTVDVQNAQSSGDALDSVKSVPSATGFSGEKELSLEGIESLSPKSNSSTETVVFDPKIINCRTINDETEGSSIESEKNEIPETKIADKSAGIEDQLKSLSSNIFTPFEFLNTTNFSAENAFANTVWSSDDNQQNSQVIEIDSSSLNKGSSNKNVTSFPEVDKFIPRWREIFPWMMWKPWIKKFFCSTCQSLHDKINSNERVIVFEINHPDDVFRVSKVLRAHSESNSHKMAVILENKSIISILLFLLRLHFNEFSTVKEIVAAFEDMIPNGPTISQDLLKITLQMVGQYLEDRIIKNLIAAKKFSLISDQCQGLLIVRWVNNENCPEEHVITSYCDVTDKTPVDYLSSLGVPTNHIIVSIINNRCENCQRCRNIKKHHTKSSTPLRLPQLDRYLIFLWRTKVLKPFYSIGTSLCKLWIAFPHKFTEISKDLPWEKLTKFPSNPSIFLDVFQQFDKCKEIAKSIYSLTGNIEALGFQTVDISQYDWLIDIFPILTTVNILLMEIKIVYPFHRDFDHLFHNVEKLKLFCEKTKKLIKEKKSKGVAIDTSDIDDLYNLVDLTVKEYQQSIYHKGRAFALAFNRINVTRNLEHYAQDINVQNSVTILFTTIKSLFKYEKRIFVKYLLQFLKEHPSCEKLNSCQILEYIQKHNLSEKNHIVFSFHRLMGYFPFQRSKYERCLYDLKVYDSLFYRSAWCGIGCNIKRYLMTIILELDVKHTLSEHDIIKWWKTYNK